MLGRFFGWLFLILTAAIVVRDGLAWRDTEFLRPETFNALWYDLSAGSLGMFRGDVLNNPGLGAALALGMILITAIANVFYLVIRTRAERWLK